MFWIFVGIASWGDSNKYPKHVLWLNKNKTRVFLHINLFIKYFLQEQIHFNGKRLGNKCCRSNEGSLYFLSLVRLMFVCLLYSGFTSLSTIFQSYCDGVWMWQGAQCSLLECCLSKISRPRHLIWYSTMQSHYTDTERATSTILKVFGMTRPGIEPTSSRSGMVMQKL